MIHPDRILLLLMLGLFTCSLSQVKPQNQSFEVMHATSQLWMSGVPGGGGSIRYRLQIKIKTDRPIRFDAIWVAGKKLQLKSENGGHYAEFTLAKNDVVTLLASDYRRGPGIHGRKEEKREAPPTETAKAPIEYHGAALLEYWVDGQAKYFAVASITVLPAIYGQ